MVRKLSGYADVQGCCWLIGSRPALLGSPPAMWQNVEVAAPCWGRWVLRRGWRTAAGTGELVFASPYAHENYLFRLKANERVGHF